MDVAIQLVVVVDIAGYIRAHGHVEVGCADVDDRDLIHHYLLDANASRITLVFVAIPKRIGSNEFVHFLIVVVGIDSGTGRAVDPTKVIEGIVYP